MEKYICRIEAGGHKYYLMTSWDNDVPDQLCKLYLTDGQRAWHAIVTDDTAQRLARSVQMGLDEYIRQTKKAFTINSSTNSNFHFGVAILSEHNTIEFAWKKYLSSEDIKFQLGKLEMVAVADSKAIISELFDFNLSLISNLNMTIASLKATNERLSDERSEALKNLQEYVATKENLEIEMYGKFIRVLNSKKNKIRTLTDQVKNMPVVPATVKAEKKVKVERDEEDNEITMADANCSGPGTSTTSTENESSLPSSSLMLEDTVSNISVTATTKRRKRRGDTAKIDTDDLPILPKTRSLRKNSGQLSRNNSTGSNSSQGRLRKNNSALPGVEDLMDEI